MQNNLWIFVVIGLVAMFFGYFFGLVEGRGQGYKRRRKDEEKAQETEPAPEVPEAADTEPIAAPPPAPADPGILRIQEDGGKMRLELDGEAVQSQGLSPAQRKRLIEIITRLRPWIEAPAQASPAPVPAPEPAAIAAAPAAPNMRPADQPRPTAPVQESPASANTMVAQIDGILQQNILGTSLAERGLKLVDERGGGVTVQIDNMRFSSIGEVTDPEVQAALRAAISLWERKYTPGA